MSRWSNKSEFFQSARTRNFKRGRYHQGSSYNRKLCKDKNKKTESGEAFFLTDLEKLRQCIIHNDEDIVVFNKPAGLAVQGGTGIRKSVDKMAAALFPYDKISLVHRLDKETSGILVVAKIIKPLNFLRTHFSLNLHIKNIWRC